MNFYTEQPQQGNDFAADRSASAVNRLARRLSRQLGLPAELIRAALIANAAVKEH
jgi:hypothetical protein